MGNVIFGTKTGAEYLSFMLDEKKMYSAWFSKVEVNGKKVLIKDESYIKNMVNAETRYKAIKLAKQFLEKMKEEDKGEWAVK